MRDCPQYLGFEETYATFDQRGHSRGGRRPGSRGIVRVKGSAEHVRLETDLLDGDLLFLTQDPFAAQTDYWFASYIGPGGPSAEPISTPRKPSTRRT
jgi:hypothetical protein